MAPGFYDRHIVPRLVDLTCGATLLDPVRRTTCAPLSGAVIEIGFGSGRNVGRYPSTVERISAIEPSDDGWGLASDRVESSTIPVERSGLDGQSLPFADDTFDSALSTFTMCTIPDLPAALAELRRVLKPGAMLCFLEHGHAPDAGVARWQRRLEPLQRRIAGGCHLTRDIPAAVTAAGFHLADLDTFYQRGVPRVFGAMSLGAARTP